MGRVDSGPPMNPETLLPQAMPLRNPSTSSLHKRLYPRFYQAYVSKVSGVFFFLSSYFSWFSFFFFMYVSVPFSSPFHSVFPFFPPFFISSSFHFLPYSSPSSSSPSFLSPFLHSPSLPLLPSCFPRQVDPEKTEFVPILTF